MSGQPSACALRGMKRARCRRGCLALAPARNAPNFADCLPGATDATGAAGAATVCRAELPCRQVRAAPAVQRVLGSSSLLSLQSPLHTGLLNERGKQLIRLPGARCSWHTMRRVHVTSLHPISISLAHLLNFLHLSSRRVRPFPLSTLSAPSPPPALDGDCLDRLLCTSCSALCCFCTALAL
jgi:hypothetical protein